MPNVLDISDITEIGVAIAEKPKILTKKKKKHKIQTTIKAAITSTEVAYATKTLVIALAFYNLII